MTSDRNRLNVTEEEIAMSLASLGEDPTVERVSLISRIIGLRSYFGGPREEVLRDAVDFVRKELLTPEPEWIIAGKAGSGTDPQTVYFASRRLGGREQFLRTESGALHTWQTNDAAIAALPALAEAHLNARLACKRVVNEAGIGFLVRMVHKGDGYGLRDQLVHDKDTPMVDIFDASGDLHPLGSSVSRYYLETLLDRRDGGLNLFGGEPDYVWSADNLHDVLTWAQAQVLAHDAKVPAAAAPASNVAVNGATLFIEAYPSEPDADLYVNFAKLEVTRPLLDRVVSLRALCVEHGLTSLSVVAAPDAWDTSRSWRPRTAALHVDQSDFWFTAAGASTRTGVETQAVPIDRLVALLGQRFDNEHDTRDFAWLDGVLYYDSTDAESLKERVEDSIANSPDASPTLDL